MCIHPEKPTIVLYIMYVKKNRASRCGAMKSQSTQTLADNQNKHCKTVLYLYTKITASQHL